MRAWLKTLRSEKNITKEIANKLGISESYYCAIENGTRQKRMDIALVAGIATIFGMSVAEIVTLETGSGIKNSISPTAERDSA